MCLVGSCKDGVSTLSLISEAKPDLVIMGLNLTGEVDAVEVCRRIKNAPDPPHVLIHAAYNLPDNICRCLLSGADSFLHKSVTCQELLGAVRKTAAGERVWLTGEQTEDSRLGTADLRKDVLLTPKEREVLTLMASHHTDAGIARRLYIGQPTVKTHTRNVLRKLGLKTRRDLFMPRST